MGFFKRLFGLEKEDQNEITQVPEMKEEPVKKLERAPIKKSAIESEPVAAPAPAAKPNSESKQKSANDAENSSAPKKIIDPEPVEESKRYIPFDGAKVSERPVYSQIDESSPKEPEAKSFKIHNFFGIDLTTSPNKNWIEDDADLDESGKPARNFHTQNKKFDEVTAKVVGSEETIYTFVNRQGINNALELYYVLLRDLKYNGHWQLWQCKNAHTKKFLDEMTHEDSWTCDDVRINFKWERYIYTTTITVHTHAYNMDYLGEPKTIDITQLEPISEENFFGVNLNPISGNEWELENESGSQRSYKANINAEKYIFDSCHISVNFYKHTSYYFSKRYSLEDALKTIFLIEQVFGEGEVDTMEKCMKKYGGKILQGTIYWNKNDYSVDYSYDANEHTYKVVVWAFRNKLCLFPDGAPSDSEKDSDSLSLPERYYSVAKVRVQGFEKLDEDEKEFVMNDLEEDMHVYLRNEFDNPQDCHALQVWYHSNLIGYIDKKKTELIHSYLREGKIGAVIVSKIKSKDFKVFVDLNVYYEDTYGEESTPYYPLEGRQISVVETDLWTGQEDWSEDWFMNIFTDELLYKYLDMYDSSVDEDEKKDVDWQLSFWINSYLDGTCITREGCKLYMDRLKTDNAKKVLMKRIESYLEHKGFHFADKELFADEEEESEEVETDNEDGTIVTDRGFTIPAKFQKFKATVDATDDAIDFFEDDEWQENDVPIVMASIIPSDEIEAINLDTQELYFTYKCEKIRSKMEEGNYVIIIVTDYKIKGDIIEVELYAQFSEKEAESSYGDVVKQYEPTYELAYIDGQGHSQRKTIKNANMNSFVAGIKYRENYEEMLSKLEEGMELQIKPEPDNEFDPDALAVYHDEDHLGYIPKKDIPAVSLNMENECGFAEIEYVDEEHIDLVIPVSFHKLATMSNDELENYRFYKTEKTKYEKGYLENSSPISKEEFLEGISQQKSNL